MITKEEAVEILRQADLPNPLRLVHLIKRAINFLDLDLTGLVILTEAASNAYVVTPVIAGLAGASRVLALTRDSLYASASAVIEQTRALEALCDVEGKTEIYTDRSLDLYAQADIITNLGFVRPISAEVVAHLKPSAVIPLMYEAWEFRTGDVDLEACHKQGIRVSGTNEDFPGLEVFDYSGWLALKMLFDAQIEVHKSDIVILSGDKFGRVIAHFLNRAGANAQLVSNLRDIPEHDWQSVDALIVADFTRLDWIIGPEGDYSTKDFTAVARGVTIVQFAGRVDAKGLSTQGVHVYPGIDLEPQHMALTLAALGPAPVIDLHTAGLKVGEMCARSGSSPTMKALAQEL